MKGHQDWRLAAAVARAGGMGSIPCAGLNGEEVRKAAGEFRKAIKEGKGNAAGPLNLNFFVHDEPQEHAVTHAKKRWKDALEPFYKKEEILFGAESSGSPQSSPSFVSSASQSHGRLQSSFNDDLCSAVELVKPEVVSFHFGLPDSKLLERVKAAGCLVQVSATTVEEAVYLENKGVDIIIAQGYEAGGHRGMFIARNVYQQVGSMALIPQIADAVSVPVIAAGGIADKRGVANESLHTHSLTRTLTRSLTPPPNRNMLTVTSFA